MVQIAKLTKAQLKDAGFSSKASARYFIKSTNKKGSNFKNLEALKKENNKMKNLGIDIDKNYIQIKNLQKKLLTLNTKTISQFNQLREKDKKLDDEMKEIESNEYLIQNDYKIPENINYKHEKKFGIIPGKLRSKYYYKWQGLENVFQNITSLYRRQDTAYKFNMSMAYILFRPKYKTDKTGKKYIYKKVKQPNGLIIEEMIFIGYEFKYFSAQYNNRLFEFPVIINNNSSLNSTIGLIKKKLHPDNMSKPDTSWKFYKFLHYEVVTFLLGTTIGKAINLPLHFNKDSNEKNIVKFENFDDNLCFWRCLAAFKNTEQKDYRRLEKPTKKLYEEFYNKKYDDEYEGIKYLQYKKFIDAEIYESEYEKTEDEIDKIEQHFKININIYTQDEENKTEIDRRSFTNYENTLYLLRYDKHFCYIKEFKNFSSSFQCCKCKKLWSTSTACIRHEKTCHDFCKKEFIGGYCEKTKSIFETLPKKYNDKRFFDYYITYDFEAILSKTSNVRTENLEYTNRHIPVSFSIFSNIPGYDKEPIFECNNNVTELIDLFIKHLVNISAKAYEINLVKYADVIRYLECQINFSRDDKEKEKNIKKFDKFIKWLREVPVVGFNSSKYDANLMKKYLSVALTKYDKPEEGEVVALKTNSMYRVISSKTLKFLDVANYLAAGVSLDKWLKAYKCTMTKGFFPYEWFDDYNLLEQKHLPPYNEWYSSLKGKNINKKQYNYCVRVWEENNMKTMKDFLQWYNNCDVIPMVEALDKMFVFYRDKGLDMFKDAISLPGLAYKMLLTSTDKKFSLFDEDNKELFDLLQKNIVGGPSIIFHRYHEIDKTRIRGDKICKKVLGYDANALYLWAIGEVMPTGDYATIDKYDLKQLVNDVMNDKLFGFVDCDIEVPEHLKEKFNEMCPIFKNIVIEGKREIIGDHMADYVEKNKMPISKSKKLIGSMFGKKILLYTPLLKWYIKQGLVITKFYKAITYTPDKCFTKIVQDVSDARRSGDKNPDMAIIAETSKLIGNALYGRCVMDKEKHTTTSYCDRNKISKKINDPHFKDFEELNDDRFEVIAGKHKITMDTPIQIGCAVYQLAKLRMLEFYYDCIDKYVDRSDFQYVEMDTDSAYLALSANRLEDVIKPHMQEEYEKDKYNWFPDETTKELKAYNKRTPGLFKVEFTGKSIYAMCSKLYFVEGIEQPLDPKKEEEKKKKAEDPNYLEDDEDDKVDKYSCKGIQKNQNEINKKRFDNVLFKDKKDICTNKGFRVIDNEMITYTQNKKGLSYYYDKRKVLADGVSTIPLDI